MHSSRNQPGKSAVFQKLQNLVCRIQLQRRVCQLLGHLKGTASKLIFYSATSPADILNSSSPIREEAWTPSHRWRIHRTYRPCIMTVACLNRMIDRPENRRIKGVVQIRDLLIAAVHSQEILGQIIGSDTEEIYLLGKLLCHHDGSGGLNIIPT